MRRRHISSELLAIVAVATMAAACGDDSRPTDTGAPPADSGTADTGGGDATADTGGGSDASGGSIPTLIATCNSANCAAGSSGIAYLAYITPDCAAIFSDGTTTIVAGRGSPFTCVGGACDVTSDDGPDPWEDEAEMPVSSIASGTYAVTAWFDHNGNILAGGGPDAGDTVCCTDLAVDAASASVTLSTGCMDL